MNVDALLLVLIINRKSFTQPRLPISLFFFAAGNSISPHYVPSVPFPSCTPSGPARKRSRLLEEAVAAGDGVGISFSPSFASDNQSLVLLQVHN